MRLLEGGIKRYIEPFVGGGAVLFEILQNYRIDEAFIFDINEDLINTYLVIQNDVESLIKHLSEFEYKYLKLKPTDRKEMFYDIRKSYNSCNLKHKQPSVERASQFIFLNRTCFNGLYRVNRSGLFNVPHGSYNNPTICDDKNLYTVNSLLQKVHIFTGNYWESLQYADSDSFVYFDPPYRPLNVTSNFTSYSKFDFTDEDQIKLANFFKKMNAKGSLLMLSNSDPKNENSADNFFDELYGKFYIHRIKAKRAINSNGEGRGLINEILVTNYKI